ncbi:hypothetical protein [Alteromonas flava]|uniref:hypothetical protein n=1 Tax=Alteromonas flava TaxID=2048003 RepID=UPI000C2900AB|nr:hypothetical protein [Alteromonas flava]
MKFSNAGVKGLAVFASALISLAFIGLLVWLFDVGDPATMLTWAAILSAATVIELYPKLRRWLLTTSKQV